MDKSIASYDEDGTMQGAASLRLLEIDPQELIDFLRKELKLKRTFKLEFDEIIRMSLWRKVDDGGEVNESEVNS